MIKNIPQNQPVLVDAADTAEATEASGRPPVPSCSRFNLGGYGFAGVAALFWLGAWAAWLWGSSATEP